MDLVKNNGALLYKDMESPVGRIRLIASSHGLAAILWESEGYGRTKLPDPVRDDHAPILLRTEHELGEYFAGTRTVFDVPVDFVGGTDFQKKVWEALRSIPFGVKKTYGDLARELGDIKAVRAVGGALNKNPVSIIVPCHRVVGGSGKLVGFAGGLKNKLILLDLENRTPDLFNP